MKLEITDLPDYAALKKFAAALWQLDDSYYGAAVMVGAGFSRIAASSGGSLGKLPLWGELSNQLATEIGASNQTDSLRLAEEYRAYFGQQALHDLLKKAINDQVWMPGDLHKKLLELPWSEVLTTNWDTLLERASVEIHQPIYTIVNRQEDLSSARSPRIAKLHGTLGITDELVFTQEDFRKYPQQHAAFVNFARQVFIENELCLLGFSGDDPNFLQWAGWVRDHLANHVRRIYLVGALNLSPAKRKYLESLNVAPIDLTPLLIDHDDADTRHREATKLFIDALKDLQPQPVWKWNPKQLTRTSLTNEEHTKTYQDADYAARLLEGQIVALEKDRLAYPGWLACPPSLLFQLRSQIADPFPNEKNLAAMTPDSRAKLLYEIVWRSELTYEVMPSWLVHELQVVCDPDKPCALTKKQQMEVALLLLKCSRWFDASEARTIAQTATAVLEKNIRHWPESANELAYHRAIVARDNFDYPAIANWVEKINPSNAVWKLRKASLLTELGHFDDGKRLVTDAYRELLNQNRKDRNSVHVLSRLAWAHWLMRGINLLSFSEEFEAFPSTYQEPKCNPRDHVDHLDERITKAQKQLLEQQGVEPLFEPGSYRDKSKTIHFGSELHPVLLLDGLTRVIGLPLRWGSVSFFVESAVKLVELDDVDDMHRLSLAIRSANSDSSDVLKKMFSRVRVANFSTETVEWLFNRCESAIDYWRDRLTGGSQDVRNHVVSRLQVFIEVLARISVRVNPEQAKEALKKGLALGRLPVFHHYWLLAPLRDLVENAIESIPPNQQHEVLMDVLSFPLRAETDVIDHLKQWPNPVIKFPGERITSPALDRRIDEIIDRIAPCSHLSAPALLRLLPLFDTGFLTEGECKKIGEKIWGTHSEYLVMPETGLYLSRLISLPSPDSFATKRLIRQYLFDADEKRLIDHTLLTSLVGVARSSRDGESLSAEQALAYFERLIAWRKIEKDRDPFGYVDGEEDRLRESIGEALAYAVVPALHAEALDKESFNKLMAFHLEVDTPATVIALACFAPVNESFAVQVEKIIRKGLQGRTHNEVSFSAFAILKWREISSSPATNRLISSLVYLLGINLGAGLASLLWTVRQMYLTGYLSIDDEALLAESVPLVFDSSDYKNISPTSREAVSISLVRAECVRLARVITEKSQITNAELLRVLEQAKQDALPEVRFAVETND